MSNNSSISVIIPVFNEQQLINSCIRKIRSNIEKSCEIIVVDGSPEGSTIQCIQDDSVIQLTGATGRAAQMNMGAENATSEILIFLHVDTELPPNSAYLVREALNAPSATAGAFNLSFDNNKRITRLISFVGNIRTRLERVPYGDQAPFIKKKIFDELKGFPLIPIMEDVELFRNIKKKKLEIVILRESAITSARRFEQTGIIRCFLRNWLLRILHLCGVNPFILKKMYSYNGVKK